MAGLHSLRFIGSFGGIAHNSLVFFLGRPIVSGKRSPVKQPRDTRAQGDPLGPLGIHLNLLDISRRDRTPGSIVADTRIE